MHALNSHDAEKMQTLANYLAHGVAQAQAGSAVGYSASRVSQLLQDESFQQLVLQKSQALAAQSVDMNTMYNAIEEQALRNLMQVTRLNQDPDLNMRLAMLANRAMRRGELAQQKPLDGKAAEGAHVHIELAFNFINRVRAGEVDVTPVVDATAGEVSIATPEVVKQLLEIGDKVTARTVPRLPQGMMLRGYNTPVDELADA